MNYIAIDIGGSQIKSAVVCENGEISGRSSVDTPRDGTPAQLLQLLSSIAEEKISRNTAGIGISTLGAVDVKKGIVMGACDNLEALTDLPLKKSMEDRFHVPVCVCNDVNAAALGEAYYGAGKDLEQFYCLTLGTGIGGAYVLNGHVIHGSHGLAGEIGYLHRHEGTCFEDRASVSAFLRICAEHGDKRTDGTEIFASAINGEQNADLFEQWIRSVACGICEIIYVYDPGTVIIGGGVSCYGRKLCDQIEKSVNEQLIPDFAGKTRIIAAAAGNNANLLGATVRFIHHS